MSVFAFLILSLLFFSFQFQQKRYAIEKKLEVDKDFLVNSLKIGDLFFITKYVVAFVDSEIVTEAGIRNSADQEWISFYPSDNAPKDSFEGSFTLKSSGIRVQDHFVLGSNSDSPWHLSYAYSISYFFLVNALALSLLISLLFFLLMRKVLVSTAVYFSRPVEALSQDLRFEEIKSLDEIDFKHYSQGTRFKETEDFKNTLTQLLSEISLQQTKLKDFEVLKALNRLSRQVNHDIQSPLGALKMAVSSLPAGTEKHKSLIERAAERIKTIAEDLKVKDPDDFVTTSKVENIDLVKLLGSIIDEKTMEYKNRSVIIDFVANIPQAPLLLDAKEFTRVISNIINNGIEAVNEEKARIKVVLEKETSEYLIKISDNGPGIPEQVLPQIFDQGFTYGKDSGSGMGLAHAKRSLEVWGGSLDVQTSPQGTTLFLRLKP